MEIRGRDRATESYVVETEVDGCTVKGLVPERLAADLRMFAARPSHQDSYVWIARNKTKIEAALSRMARGAGRPKAPFDQITLIEER